MVNSVRNARGLSVKLGLLAAAAGIAMLMSPVSAVAAQPQVAKMSTSKAQRAEHCRRGGSEFRWDSRANHGKGACFRVKPAPVRQQPAPAPNPPAPVSCEHRIPKCS